MSMNSPSYEKLCVLLNQLKNEKADYVHQIEENTLQIAEARSYTLEIMGKEEEDFRVFSPRTIRDIYKEELDKSQEKQDVLENSNTSLQKKIDELDSYIILLDEVAEEMNSLLSGSEEKKDTENIDNDILDSSDDSKESSLFVKKSQLVGTISNLNRAVHKIETCSKLVSQDPSRTKIELKQITKKIQASIDFLSSIGQKYSIQNRIFLFRIVLFYLGQIYSI